MLDREGRQEMSTNNKLTVYRLDVVAANEHLCNIGSWYHPSPTERLVIIEPAHDDYVRIVVINDNLAGALPRRLLISTDEDVDEVIAAYEATGRKLPPVFAAEVERAKQDAQGKLDLPL